VEAVVMVDPLFNVKSAINLVMMQATATIGYLVHLNLMVMELMEVVMVFLPMSGCTIILVLLNLPSLIDLHFHHNLEIKGLKFHKPNWQ
jgi:type III secretory pathway component EscU